MSLITVEDASDDFRLEAAIRVNRDRRYRMVGIPYLRARSTAGARTHLRPRAYRQCCQVGKNQTAVLGSSAMISPQRDHVHAMTLFAVNAVMLLLVCFCSRKCASSLGSRSPSSRLLSWNRKQRPNDVPTRLWPLITGAIRWRRSAGAARSSPGGLLLICPQDSAAINPSIKQFGVLA